MMDDVTRGILRREGDALSRPLFDGIETAMAQSSDSLKQLPPRDYPHVFAGARRAFFRESLLQMGLPDGWMVRGNPRMNGQIVLAHEDLGITLRVLSESRVTANGVPHAGHTSARRDAWTVVQPTLFAMPTSIRADRRLLLLGRFDLLEPSLRIVRPISPGKYQGNVPCDYGLVLRPAAQSWDDRSFAGSDEHEDLFNVNISKEEDGSAND